MAVKLVRRKKGQALVEFAIILPVIMLLLMGILQFGMMLNSYLEVQNAAREGARTGIVGSTDTGIRNQITAISPGLDSRNMTISINPVENQRKSGDTLTIKITYSYQMTVPIISNFFSRPIQLNAQTSMRVE
ncbi:MAG: pilus assembly protein [Bacillota bacterium]|nr:pilus assembly protein [Bacillota bacterium]